MRPAPRSNADVQALLALARLVGGRPVRLWAPMARGVAELAAAGCAVDLMPCSPLTVGLIAAASGERVSGFRIHERLRFAEDVVAARCGCEGFAVLAVVAASCAPMLGGEFTVQKAQRLRQITTDSAELILRAQADVERAVASLSPGAGSLADAIDVAVFDRPLAEAVITVPGLVKVPDRGVLAAYVERFRVDRAADLPRGYQEVWTAVLPERAQRNIVRVVLADGVEKPTVRRFDRQPGEITPLPLWMDDVPTAQTVLTTRRMALKTAAYYRDLFAHRLGPSNIGHPMGIYLDGKLMGVVAVDTANIRTAKSRMAYVVFSFSAPGQHPRLHKLLLMTCVSSWFWREVFANPLDWRPEMVQTVMWTPYPEVKTARGIMKLAERETVGDGYKLTYTAPLVARSPEETMSDWCERYGR